MYFYPRPPRGGRQRCIHSWLLTKAFLSTPSARRATNIMACPRCGSGISIHALREEGDMGCLLSCCIITHFYPRPPRGGRRVGRTVERKREKFLSTPSARRATEFSRIYSNYSAYFYPRPPRGGRRPRGWSCAAPPQFLSTPSARRATAKTETKSLFSYKLYNILHEFRRALIYNGSKNYPNHAK